MEIVNIFLAGSTRLEAHRNIIRSCANKLQADNNSKGRNIAINITTFENFTSAITGVSAQELYDAYIRTEADFAMFVFDNEIGGISKHEFDVAFETFKRSNKPQLYIYFKKDAQYCDEYQSIREQLLGTSNYFIEYDDISHFSKIIDSHLREIIDSRIERIIISSYKENGYLALASNKRCSVSENNVVITDLIPDSPCMVQMSEGLHCLCFKELSSSNVIERKVRVIRNSKRSVQVVFPSAAPTPSSNYAYFILSAVFVVLVAGIVVLVMQNADSAAPYTPDETVVAGGDKYQYALQAIEQGNTVMAEELLQNVVNGEPLFADPYIHLAAIYIQQGNTEKARELLLKALRIEPHHQWANDMLESINNKDY